MGQINLTSLNNIGFEMDHPLVAEVLPESH